MSTFALPIYITYLVLNLSPVINLPMANSQTTTLSPTADSASITSSYLLRQLPISSFSWSDAFNSFGVTDCEFPQYPSLHTNDAWCAATTGDSNSYLQANLSSLYHITSVSTWGRDSTANQFVTSYHLSYSIDGDTFTSYGLLTGNVDKTTEKKNDLIGNIIAQYLRFTPVTYNNHKSMRIEASGFEYIQIPTQSPTTSEPTQQTMSPTTAEPTSQPTMPSAEPTFHPLSVTIRQNVSCGTFINDSLSFAGEKHYYSFRNQYDNLDITITTIPFGFNSLFDTDLTIYDTHLNELLYVDRDSSNDYRAILSTTLSIGTYIIMLDEHYDTEFGQYYIDFDCILPTTQAPNSSSPTAAPTYFGFKPPTLAPSQPTHYPTTTPTNPCQIHSMEVIKNDASECILFDTISSHPDIHGDNHNIGWIKMISCTDGIEDGEATFTIHRPDYELLATQAISIRFQTPNGSIDDDMTLIAKPYSNPILYGLNRGKEVSYTYEVNGDIADQVNKNNWIGTSKALGRLGQTCTANGIVYNISDRIYQSCGMPGLHILRTGWPNCAWEHKVPALPNSHIEIYFGFKPPTLAPTSAPTTPPTLPPSTAPTQPPSLAPTTSPSLSPSSQPTQSPTRYPTITDPYDSYFQVTYTLSFKHESYINYININFTRSLQEIQEIIERGYATNNNVKTIWFRDFWLNITSINDQFIQDLTKNNELFILEQQDSLINSRVECSRHVCQEIHENTDITSFEKDVTKELNDYFKIYQSQESNADVDDISTSELILNFSVTEMSEIQSPDSKPSELYIPWWIWLIISVIAILVFVLYRYNKYRNHKKLEQKTTHIYNPMVITVAIGFYEQSPKKKEINGHLRDLDGIRVDIDNALKFFGNDGEKECLKYDIYPKMYFQQNIDSYKAWWDESELVQFLQKQADKLESNLKQYDVSEDERYDSLLLLISCHGIEGYIITSDYKKIQKTAIHRIFSANKPLSRKIPRIFLFDCCSGDADRDTDFRWEIDHDDSDDEVTKGNFDIGKQVKAAEIEQDITWARDEDNPDFKLIVINAANDGFQSKMRSDTGSYVITGFIDNVRDNIFMNNNKRFLNDILTGIQTSLHDDGKQLITKMFNNGTEFIKFHPNDRNIDGEMIASHNTNTLGESELVKIEQDGIDSKGIKKTQRNKTRTLATDKSKQEDDEIGKSIVNDDNDNTLEMKWNEGKNADINDSNDNNEEKLERDLLILRSVSPTLSTDYVDKNGEENNDDGEGVLEAIWNEDDIANAVEMISLQTNDIEEDGNDDNEKTISISSQDMQILNDMLIDNDTDDDNDCSSEEP